MPKRKVSFERIERERGKVNRPINQTQRPVLVPLPHISRPQPPVLREYRLIIIQIVPFIIPARHRRAPYQHLPARALARLGRVREITRFGDVEQLDLDGGRRQADGAVLHCFGGEDGTHPARLGHSVACGPCRQFPSPTKKRVEQTNPARP